MYILVQFLVYRISSLQFVDNVISSTRSTGPLHHSSQLLFMITLFNQPWSVVIITNNSINFLRERWKQEWSSHSGTLACILQQWECLLLSCSLHCFFFFDPSNQEHCQWCASKALWKYTCSIWYNWACSHVFFLILEIVLTAATTVIYQYNPSININVTWKCTLKFQWHS